MAGKTDGRQLRWDSHNQARREHILDAAIGVLADAEPGLEVHVQQIADRAGLSRTVVYRHFSDRADLDAAVQGRALELLRAELVPALSFEGTPVDIIRRIVSAYVGWASEHPSLHEFAQQDPPGPGIGQMETAIQQIAGQIEDLINVGVELLNVRLTEDDVAALDPLVFGLVGAVFTSTRRWLGRPEQKPDREKFVELVTEAVWLQIAGMAAARGVELDPGVPVEALLEAAFDGTAQVSGVTDDQPVFQAGVGEADDLDRLWTPHRMAYIRGENKPADGTAGECPFCRIPSLTDEEGLVVHRGETAYAVLNLYPYSPGHLMVCPYRHVADYTDTTDQEAAEIAAMTKRAMTVIRSVSGAGGFNIGMNQGHIAGAGIAAHLHQHVVPRWPGDQNFMPIIGRTKTLPELLSDTRDLLATAWTG